MKNGLPFLIMSNRFRWLCALLSKEIADPNNPQPGQWYIDRTRRTIRTKTFYQNTKNEYSVDYNKNFYSIKEYRSVRYYNSMEGCYDGTVSGEYSPIGVPAYREYSQKEFLDILNAMIGAIEAEHGKSAREILQERGINTYNLSQDVSIVQ